jgi:hypothetical protein
MTSKGLIDIILYESKREELFKDIDIVNTTLKDLQEYNTSENTFGYYDLDLVLISEKEGICKKYEITMYELNEIYEPWRR